MNKKLSLFSSLFALSLAACGGTPATSQASSGTPTPTIEPEPDNKVSVFVLAGQSNMEGSTFYDNGKDWLRKAMDELGLDPDPCFDGMDEVQTSFYGFYPYQGNWQNITPHCSNPEDPLAGAFLPTKVGMGNRDDLMGPELGIAYGLKDFVDVEKPVFLIKCAFSGAGFESQSPTWKSRSLGTENELYDRLVTYTQNNLDIIEDMGYDPVIKSLIWHQGESDTNNSFQASHYQENLGTLVSDFREDFGAYGIDGDGENINFIDALIYDGNVLHYSAVEELNDAKIALSEESEHNFCINTSTHREGGLNLVIGGGANNSDVNGCYNVYHYITIDCVRLGLAYADVILDNGMLD